LPNFAAISQTVIEICRFFIFQEGGRRHLGFSKSENFRGGKAQDVQSASSYQISRRSVKPLLRYGDFSIFQDGGRPPSWICDDPRRAFGDLYHFAKFGWNRRSSFDDMHVFDFTSLPGERLFTPQNCTFWDLTP